MIKYEIKTGDKALNQYARDIRERSKIQLRGMHCKKCGTDTFIRFVEKSDSPTGYVILVEACCADFEKRIKTKLNDPI